MRLVVDGAPTAAVRAGEAFTVAVLVQGDDGGDDTEYEGAVRVEASAGRLEGETEVLASFGEALFTDITWNGGGGDAEVTLRAEADGDPHAVCETATLAVVGAGGAADDAAAAAGVDDALVNDPAVLLPRACDPSASATTAQHHLTVLKGGLWNAPGNRAFYEAADAKTQLVGLLTRKFLDDAAAVVLILSILRDLLSFRGAVKTTCSRCHGVIPTGTYLTTHDTEMGAPDGAPVVRSWMFECFLDAATQAPVFDKADVRVGAVLDYDMANHQPHVKGTGPPGSAPAQAVVATLGAAGDADAAMCDAPLDAIFQAQLARALRAVLRAHAADEYVVEKMQGVVGLLAANNPLLVSGLPPLLVP